MKCVFRLNGSKAKVFSIIDGNLSKQSNRIEKKKETHQIYAEHSFTVMRMCVCVPKRTFDKIIANLLQ